MPDLVVRVERGRQPVRLFTQFSEVLSCGTSVQGVANLLGVSLRFVKVQTDRTWHSQFTESDTMRRLRGIRWVYLLG